MFLFVQASSAIVIIPEEGWTDTHCNPINITAISNTVWCSYFPVINDCNMIVIKVFTIYQILCYLLLDFRFYKYITKQLWNFKCIVISIYSSYYTHNKHILCHIYWIRVLFTVVNSNAHNQPGKCCKHSVKNKHPSTQFEVLDDQ